MQFRERSIRRIEAQADGPARAPHRRRELSASLPTGALYDVKLLVSELVTNGIRDGPRGPGAVITLDRR